ncbi:MAG: protein-glutamate O-methyltransferase CheR [Sediminibacterium sp.]|nr:protein-glutamate O-methyltransferase CheR [Sediminibacterium sp.]
MQGNESISPDNVSPEEVRQFIKLLKEEDGIDFSGYAPASLGRRIAHVLSVTGVKTVDELRQRVVADKGFIRQLVEGITVNTTSMFRDPLFWSALRNDVFTALTHHQTIRIWHAGCSSGEEVYSMAILLHELGLQNKTIVYATDVNERSLSEAKEGKYSVKSMNEAIAAMRLVLPESDIKTYTRSGYPGSLHFKRELVRNVRFKKHNLLSDPVFYKFDLILCRNVMIYFTQETQDKVIALFRESLLHNAFMATGSSETLSRTGALNDFELVNPVEKIYRKKSGRNTTGSAPY